MKIVPKWLGQKNLKTTLNMYVHIMDEDDPKASDVFNTIFLLVTRSVTK